MTIVFYSPNFHPLTGGLENVVRDLAFEFTRAGHRVTVITSTAGAGGGAAFPFAVLRRKSLWQQIRAMRRADLVLQFNVSLKGLLPWFFSGRPLVVSHQTPHSADWRGRLKTWAANHLAALNIGCSAYMARFYRRSMTIPNPYDDALFRARTPWAQRSGDLVFLGRLVSDKGAEMLLTVLAELKKEGLQPGLTIIGSGPEEPRLRQLVAGLYLGKQVEFAGVQKGGQLAETLNRHRIVVVPSVWQEPFGIVALEGLACGCLVVGSAGGGLGEAIGGFGLTFPNNDALQLLHCLRTALTRPESCLPDAAELARHLDRHRRQTVAQKYLDAIEPVLERR